MNLMIGLLSEIKLLGTELIDIEDFAKLAIRFSFNFISILIIVRYLYYSSAKRKDYLFTYILISVVVFLLCFLLENVKLQLGFALGLFAIFGIIRYRTNPIPIKEMTYLFIVIGVSVINALANKKISYTDLIFTNLVIILIIWLLEKVFLSKHANQKTILYDKIELIKLENRELLKKDLEERTGLKIEKIEISRIDFLKSVAKIIIYYFESDNQINYSENENSNDINEF